MSYDEIGLCAQNVDIILGSLIDVIKEGLCDCLTR